MARGVIQFSITDAAGNVVPEASVEVRNSDTLSLVGLWEQRSGGDALGNPAQADEDGYFRAYCNPQRVNITATLGEFERTWIDVAVIDEGRELPVFDSGTWEPAVTFGTPGDLSLVYGTRTALWSRVGKQVAFSMRMVFTPTFSTTSGQFRVTCPFSSFATGSQTAVGSVMFISNAPDYAGGRTESCMSLDGGGTFFVVTTYGSGIVSQTLQSGAFSGGGATEYGLRASGVWIYG